MRRVWWLLAVMFVAAGCSPEQTEAWLGWWRDEPRAAVRWARHDCGALCTDDWDGDGIVEPEPETETISVEADVDDEGSESAGVYWPWDALAECESGGDWTINTGNNFYGGLQFALESWQAVGGSGYPHDASPSEQVARAEILLDIQGWDAWPTCSSMLGLG